MCFMLLVVGYRLQGLVVGYRVQGLVVGYRVQRRTWLAMGLWTASGGRFARVVTGQVALADPHILKTGAYDGAIQ